MSEWNKADKDDIDIDFDCAEVNILVTDNEFGNIYVTLTFEQIMEINKKIDGTNSPLKRK